MSSNVLQIDSRYLKFLNLIIERLKTNPDDGKVSELTL
jgi:hypothetical protein